MFYSQDGEFHFTIKPEARQQSYKPEQGIENSLKVIMKETAEMCDINELVQVIIIIVIIIIIIIIITIINQFLFSLTLLETPFGKDYDYDYDVTSPKQYVLWGKGKPFLTK